MKSHASRATEVLVVIVLAFGNVALCQNSQTRILQYSTYVNSPPLHGDTAAVAANSSGQVCASTEGGLLKINADGSQAYQLTYSDLGMTLAVSPASAIDGAGNCYVGSAGTIKPTPGAFQTVPGSNSSNFLVKFDASGKIVFATYLSGSNFDFALGLALDPSGNLWETGYTESNDFPLQNPIQNTYQGGTSDAFVAELKADGSRLLFGTYLGGSNNDIGYGIAIDSVGNAYIAGSTQSANFPLMNPLESTLMATSAAFVTKVTVAGQLVYSSYLGETSNAGGAAIAVDDSQDMWVTGTAGPGFPLVNPIQSTGINSSFISELNAAGSGLLYSTYFGGAVNGMGSVSPVALKISTHGNAYVGGTLFPGELGGASVPLLNAIENDAAGYVAALNSSGALLFSTYFGGAGGLPGSGLLGPALTSLSVDSSENLYAGNTAIAFFPVPLINSIYGTMEPLIESLQPSRPYVAKIGLLSGPSFSMPSGVDFGIWQIGQSVPQNINIYNTGTTDVAISNIGISGNYTQTNNCPTTLTAATQCQFNVTFTPASGGSNPGAITITDNSPGSPHIIQLMGSGAVPVVQLNPTSLTFSTQAVGSTSPAQIATLTNTGTAALNLGRISTSGDFAETNNCGAMVAQEGNCVISVTFTPTSTGTRNGTLSISDNAAGSPQTVPLTGTGGAPGLGLGVASGNSNSATVTAGQAANYKLSIGGAGVSGMATLTCAGTPTGATCSLPASVNVSASTASTFTVSVSTTGASALSVPSSSKLTWTWAVAFFGVFLIPAGARREAVNRLWLLPLLLLLLLGSGCGGGSSPPGTGGTPAGTYTLTVQATLDATTGSMPLTLKVQ
jgi:hypothetical protein